MMDNISSSATAQTVTSIDISSTTVTTSITDTTSFFDIWVATVTTHRTATVTEVRIELPSSGSSSDYAALRSGIIAVSVVAGFLLLAVILLAWLLVQRRRADSEDPFLDPVPPSSSASTVFGDDPENIGQGKFMPHICLAFTLNHPSLRHRWPPSLEPRPSLTNRNRARDSASSAPSDLSNLRGSMAIDTIRDSAYTTRSMRYAQPDPEPAVPPLPSPIARSRPTVPPELGVHVEVELPVGGRQLAAARVRGPVFARERQGGWPLAGRPAL
ncbi:hypothetical protein ONZ51_g13218 [Trametes cubensis]|uniref:Uncharacterized protein n=1 Tax=Trametes cubensis TaxID=1111947 RepID=A0AAD7X661_9APHY|nr:hypothetical protein ONZ51_g13218 [Trametes cubensis]